ncbi:DUF6714 family protein [Ectopseudomonas toyotomiensis]|uniref:DUF6714 family protein n=1 Tax=Ectopseudomonas toyotomiensis TaxID=554344 RepID=UPI00117A2D57|nr:DUF6714 family protein [Pseudomonas sp. ALS1131]TRO37128.1 hypothetical protein EQ832_14310 [Pseudomonas sp. ALS1131]
MDIVGFVESTYQLFEAFEKPESATDVEHCEECRDHNDEINNANRRDLSSEQIGTVCWGISSFLTPQAMGYYIPRFIELAVTGQNDKEGSPYMCLFINQIGLNAESLQFSEFSSEQRQAVYKSLIILKTEYMNTLIEHCWETDIDTAITQWST